jgi:hypothetical protein
MIKKHFSLILLIVLSLLSIYNLYDMLVVHLVSIGMIPDNGYDEAENIKNIIALIFK